jgi:squalene-hopene/tetraprenyl-beta-curcumene cyclase
MPKKINACKDIGLTSERLFDAVNVMLSYQNPDGGWGESNKSYYEEDLNNHYLTSTAFQTAWAVIALCVAGETHSVEVKAGVDYLLRKQQADGVWNDPVYTAPGFPKVFYLKYHGYDKFFPLWALARYRNELLKK